MSGIPPGLIHIIMSWRTQPLEAHPQDELQSAHLTEGTGDLSGSVAGDVCPRRRGIGMVKGVVLLRGAIAEAGNGLRRPELLIKHLAGGLGNLSRDHRSQVKVHIVVAKSLRSTTETPGTVSLPSMNRRSATPSA